MEALRSFWLWLLIWLRIVPKPDLLARIAAEHPEPGGIEPGLIYIVGGAGYAKWAYFRCPSDHGEIIQLSLMAGRHPRWEIKIDWLGRPTIEPSVRQLDGSYAHFWVRKGRVDWCADTGRKPAART
jgi:hypothetical protein